MTWRSYADWAKHKPIALRIADWLGRGKGRARWLDHLYRPKRAPLTPELSQWEQHTLAAAWIGHATILLRIGKMTILTDPVFLSGVGLGFGLFTGGPRRFVAPALTLKQLPPIDLLLISHAHFDHLDRPTLSRLPRNMPVITAKDTRDLIDDLGFQSVTEIGWGESTTVGELKITAQQVEHWGARTFHDAHRGYNAYLIESGSTRVLYGADSAYHEHFRSIGKVDLAIIGIGAYNPWIKGHANPEQAWEMARHVEATHVLPMHHSTFRLSHEPMTEPMDRLLAAAGSEDDKIVIREIGGMWVGE